MGNIAGYIANLGKSVAYAASDRVKEATPAIADFHQTNSELFKNVYTNVRDYKNTYRRTVDMFKQTKFYEAQDEYKTALMEDIKSGKFYNKKRKEAFEMKGLMGDMGSDNFDDSGFEDIGDFDDSSFNMDDGWGGDDGDIMVAKSVHEASMDNAQAVSMTVAKSAEYTASVQKQTTNMLYTQNAQAFGMIHTGLGAMNSNIASLMPLVGLTQSQNDNQIKFFESSEKLQQDQVALLRQINDKLTTMVPEKKEEKVREKKVRFGDITPSSGMPDLKEYMKVIKNNVKDQLGAAGSAMDMFGEDSNILLAMAGSPLQFIPKMIINQIVPKAFDKSAAKLDRSLQGFFGSLISKFNTMAQDDDATFFSKILGKTFGVRNSVKSKLDTANYNKEQMPWNGKAHKALTEVIPMYLSKILSAIDGQSERLYDYDKGQLFSANDIEKELKGKQESYYKQATSDMREEFETMMKVITFNSKQERDQLQKDYEAVFKQLYDNGTMFNVNSAKKDQYLDYGVSSKNFALIKAMYRNSDTDKQLSLNRNILETRDRQNAEMEGYEGKGSRYEYKYNNFNPNQYVKYDKDGKLLDNKSFAYKNSALNVLDNLGHNAFYYLQNMYKELQLIRYNAAGGTAPTYAGSVGTYSGRIDGNQTGYHPYQKTTADMKIPDDNKAAQKAIRKMEHEQYQDTKYLESEQKRMQKYDNVFNASNIDDDRDAEMTFQSKIRVFKTQEEVRERSQQEKTFMQKMVDELVNAESLTDRMKVVTGKLNELSAKPMDFITNTIDKVDRRLYELIYGKEGGHGENVKGIMDLFAYKMKSSFGQINLWLEENILDPLKNKLDIDHFSDLKDKFLEKTGMKDLGSKIKDYLFGNKDTGEKGLFGDTKDAIANTFKGAWESVKGAFGNVFNPLRNKWNAKKPFNALDNDYENQIEEAREYSRQAQSMKEAEDRQRQSEHEKRQSYYENMDWTKAEKKLSINSRINYKRADVIAYDRENRHSQMETLGRRRDAQFMWATDPTNKKSDTNEAEYYELDKQYAEEQEFFDRYNRNKLAIERLERRKKNKGKYKYPIGPEFVPKKYQYNLMSPESEDLIEENPSSSFIGGGMNKIVSEGVSYLKEIRDSILSVGRKTIGKINNGFNPKNVFNDLKPQSGFDPTESAAANAFSTGLAKVISEYMHGNAKFMAGGSQGELKDSTVAVVRKGEIVMTAEEVDSLKEIIGEAKQGVIKGKKNKNTAKFAFNSMNKFLKDVPEEKLPQYLDMIGKMLDDEMISKDFNESQRSNYGRMSGALKNRLNDRAENYSFGEQTMHELGNGVKLASEALTGKSSKQQKDLFGKAIDDITGNISMYAPDAIGSGLLGGGVSLLTGAMGGPLLGAAVGAGVSLAKNSAQVQSWLFGEKVDDEGNRSGGLIGADFQKKIKKYLPDLKSYGIVGGIAGLTPFLPFGPIAGVMLGGAFSYLKNNEAVQKSLFGEGGLFKPEAKDKLKSMLPRIAGGALVGSFFGPFGLLGNALLGSGVGMLTTTKKFQHFILGEKNKQTGKYEGGMLPAIRNEVLDPLKDIVTDLKDKAFDFIEKQMLNPLKTAFNPLSKQVELLTKSVFNTFNTGMQAVFEKTMGIPFGKWMEDKVLRRGKNIANVATFIPRKALKWGATVPFKAIGAIGEHYRANQIASGDADYMSAAERMEYRTNHRISMGLGRAGKDKMGNFDKHISSDKVSTEQLEEMFKGLDKLDSSHAGLTKQKNGLLNDMGADVSAYMSYDESYKIMKAIKKGDLEKAKKLIYKNKNISIGEKQKLWKTIEKKGGEYSAYSDEKNVKDTIFHKATSMLKDDEKFKGLDIDGGNISLYTKLLKNEIDSRKTKEKDKPVEQKILDQDKVQHNQIVGLFNKLINAVIYGKDGDPNEAISIINGANKGIDAAGAKQVDIKPDAGIMKLHEKRKAIAKNLSTSDKKVKTFGHTERDTEGIEWITDSEGNKIANKGDAQTVDILKAKKEKDAEEKTWKDKMFGFFKKNELEEDEEGNTKKKKKKKKSILDTLLSGSILKKVGLVIGGAVAVAQVPKITKYLKENFGPWMKETVFPWIKKEGIPQLINGLSFVVKELPKQMIGGLRQLIGNSGGGLAKLIQDAIVGVGDGLKSITHEIVPMFIDGTKFLLKEGLPIIGQIIKEGVGVLWEATKSLVPELGKLIWDFGGYVMKGSYNQTLGRVFGKKENNFDTGTTFYDNNSNTPQSATASGSETAVPSYFTQQTTVSGGNSSPTAGITISPQNGGSVYTQALNTASTGITYNNSYAPSAPSSGQNGYNQQQDGQLTGDDPHRLSDGEAAANTFGALGRNILTKGATGNVSKWGNVVNAGFKVGAKVIDVISPMNGLNFLRHPFKRTAALFKDGIKSLAPKSIVGNMLRGTGNIVENAGKITTSLANGRGLEDGVKILEKGAASSNGLIASMCKNIEKFILELATNPTIQKYIGADRVKDIINKFTPKFVKSIEENLVKNVAKVTGKLAAAVSTGGLLNIAWAVADFISGFRDARNMLQITEEPSFTEKIGCGFLKALSGLFIITSLIPEKVLADLILVPLLSLFEGDEKELQEARDIARNEVDKYNKEHGTNYSVEDYNDKVLKQDTGFVAGVKSAFEKFTSMIPKVGNTKNFTTAKQWQDEADRKSKLSWTDNIKDNWSNLKQQSSDLWNNLFGNKGGPNYDYSGIGSPNFDFGYTGMGGASTANGINAVLRGKLAGMGQTYIDIGNKYGIDPALAASITMQETGGNSTALNNDNNPAGVMDWNNNWKTVKHFNSLQEGLDFSIKNLKTTFIDKGKTSIAQIGAEYAPIGAANDPKGLNKEWIPSVTSFYKQMTGDETVNNPSATGSNANGTSEPAKPTIFQMFDEMGSAFSNAFSRLYGFDPHANESATSESGTTVAGDAGKIINTAKSELGKPYQLGATGPDKFDCSGLVQYAYKQNGIDLSRTTYTQVNEGVGVDNKKDLKPADLVFFNRSSRGPEHVGMYLGDDQFIQAPKTGDVVKISRLSSRGDYYTGRRILKDPTSGKAPTFTYTPQEPAKTSDTIGAMDQIKASLTDPRIIALNNSAPKFNQPAKESSNSDSLYEIDPVSKLPKPKGLLKDKGGPADSFFTNSLGGVLTSPFGPRKGGGVVSKNHTGIDIATRRGTSIKSPISGTVVKTVGTGGSNGFGNLAVVRDNRGADHYFGHMQGQSGLSVGSKVKPGESIGNVGSTGNSTGPHVHYEVRAGQIPIEPNKYLSSLGKGGENDSSSSDNKLLTRIVEQVVRIADNSDKLTQIVELLTKLVTGKSDTSTDNNSTTNTQSTTTSKQTILDKIKSSGGSMDNSSLLELMDSLATE